MEADTRSAGGGARRDESDWHGTVVAIYEGERKKQFFVLSYTHPVYMLKEQRRAPHARMHFYMCVAKDRGGDCGDGAAGDHDDPQDERTLPDTREFSADDYLYIRKRYKMCNVSSCAGPNDETAVLFAAGLLVI